MRYRSINAVNVLSNMFTHPLVQVKLCLWVIEHFTELEMDCSYLPTGPLVVNKGHRQ